MKRFTAIIFTVSALGGLAFASHAFAHEGHEVAKQGASNAPAVASEMSSGEVKKIDKSAGKVTIKHGPLENLGMPGMTMVFKVKDPAMLDTVKVGDQIRFTAEKINGSLTLTQLEASK